MPNIIVLQFVQYSSFVVLLLVMLAFVAVSISAIFYFLFSQHMGFIYDTILLLLVAYICNMD